MNEPKKWYPKGQHPNQIAAREKLKGTAFSLTFNGKKIKRAKWNAAGRDYRKRLRDAYIEGEAKPYTLTGGYVKVADRPSK